MAEEEIDDYRYEAIIAKKPCWLTPNDEIHCWCVSKVPKEAKEHQINPAPGFYFSYVTEEHNTVTLEVKAPEYLSNADEYGPDRESAVCRANIG